MNQVVEALSLLTPFDIDRPKIRIGPKTDGGYIFVNDISANQLIALGVDLEEDLIGGFRELIEQW